MHILLLNQFVCYYGFSWLPLPHLSFLIVYLTTHNSQQVNIFDILYIKMLYFLKFGDNWVIHYMASNSALYLVCCADSI